MKQPRLTPREERVMELRNQNYTQRQIAQELFGSTDPCSIKAVDNAVQRARFKGFKAQTCAYCGAGK